MKNTLDDLNSRSRGRSFELWMVSNIAIGAGFSAFITLLIPPYVTETTGKAANAGIVMAVISLAAIVGPIIGGLADKLKAHRLFLNMGILGMAISFVMFAFTAEVSALSALDSIVMGVSIASVSTIAPVFIVGAGLSKSMVAKRLTAFNVVAPVGQVLGGAIMAAAATAGLSYKIRFFIAAAVMFICFIITWFSSKKPASRIQVEIQAPQQAPKGKKSSGFGKVILSIFGAYLLVLIMSSIANNGINAQISNILPNVYGIDAVTTSGLIALAGLLNIVFFIVAGLLLRKYSALSVITIGHILRLLGSVFMAILGMIAKSPILLVAASMQMLYQGTPFVRLSQPVVAVRFATFGAGSASGWVLAASAIGSFIGSLLGGFLADSVGYNAINWMAGGAAVLGTVVLIFVMWPAEKRKQKIELAESKKSS